MRLYRVTTNAKRPNHGSLSQEHYFEQEPDAETLKKLKADAKRQFQAVYGAGGVIVVDLQIRTTSPVA